MRVVVRISGIVSIMLLLLGAVTGGVAAKAQYFRRPVSQVDPRIMQIDEKKVLGAKIDEDTVLIEADGKEFRWGDMLGKPLILVLSYYTCDGSCSIINATLAELLGDVKAVAPGQDFRILTLSFDIHDSAKTIGAFRKHLDLAGPLAKSWNFARFKNEADLKAQTEKVGFKFFWSPEDRIFLHPGAFLFFSPEGRLIRILYQQSISGRDVELAILDAKQGQFRPAEIINFALSLCYSYSYQDGKYVVSIPLVVGVGALAIGLATLFGSVLMFRSSARRKATGDDDYAKVV